MVPIILLFLGGFIFGWAKPVPVNDHAFKNSKRDMALVALAGPIANLLMAILGVDGQTQHHTTRPSYFLLHHLRASWTCWHYHQSRYRMVKSTTLSLH